MAPELRAFRIRSLHGANFQSEASRAYSLMLEKRYTPFGHVSFLGVFTIAVNRGSNELFQAKAGKKRQSVVDPSPQHIHAINSLQLMYVQRCYRRDWVLTQSPHSPLGDLKSSAAAAVAHHVTLPSSLCADSHGTESEGSISARQRSNAVQLAIARRIEASLSAEEDELAASASGDEYVFSTRAG
jgi:hypothetical protein